jgi:hypothetical protein
MSTIPIYDIDYANVILGEGYCIFVEDPHDCLTICITAHGKRYNFGNREDGYELLDTRKVYESLETFMAEYNLKLATVETDKLVSYQVHKSHSYYALVSGEIPDGRHLMMKVPMDDVSEDDMDIKIYKATGGDWTSLYECTVIPSAEFATTFVDVFIKLDL